MIQLDPVEFADRVQISGADALASDLLVHVDFPIG
jgi:hypothetical protein